MNIEDLYIELGRSLSAANRIEKDIYDARNNYDSDKAELNREFKEATGILERRQQTNSRHIDELKEAIRMADNGTDPTIAKLTAKESLVDRNKEIARMSGQTVNITGGMATSISGQLYNPLYINNQAYAAAASSYFPAKYTNTIGTNVVGKSK